MMMAQEFHPLRRQSVDIRCLVVIAPETRDIRVTEIVGH